MRHGTPPSNAPAEEQELDAALRAGPFHAALRAAIAARSLSLQRVQHHLARQGVKVGVTSLSYWQQGARRPQRPESLRAVRALEEILELPEESLIRLLAQPGGVGGPRRPAARTYRSLVEASGVLERLLGELGSPLDGGLHTIGHHERVSIGARRELLGRESHHVVRAHKDGVDRYVAIHHGDPGCAPERVTVGALENCRTGRVRWHGATGVLVAEFLFDTRLRAGDTHVFRYAFEDGTAGASQEYVRGFSFAGGQYLLQVRFAEEALPVRSHRFVQHSAAAPRQARHELDLNGRHRCVHFVEPQVRAGLLGIDWDWD
ncbi:hypothetical protein [Streptomyces uncialis]|uniref:XRE family transcriptional regulator n=1 Tax=Streptomyces uncialis TaxID=1048205 RepID=A0A1Q4V504_9ACTN|nr:hypothetical protein [Streptomyces uncialis]MCX4663128.1 hypothetical protein [Streptomyces uncialis]OKH92926.1 hypothetical protein AB852_20660 [Streptomyces uncialis]WST72981.1 hypothetical protein OG268_28655 [Streptomyces uncialis]WTE15470.1 hypothetical protein OG924_08180 [Streptomyces uncialis]